MNGECILLFTSSLCVQANLDNVPFSRAMKSANKSSHHILTGKLRRKIEDRIETILLKSDE
jgi:hypothetical protein